MLQPWPETITGRRVAAALFACHPMRWENVWVDMGPRDTLATFFVAHMDEVGFEVESFSTAFSVDTFVSSDTPLESEHFAHAPLGRGPVFRAIENSSMASPSERERIPEIASAAGVVVQMGLTQGGTDGTTFTFWGAPDAGLSWPGRYSQSPAEVLDLRDLADLSRVIVALAVARD